MFWLQVKFEITAFQNDGPRRVPFYVIISWIKYEDILKLYISFNNNDEFEICFGQKVGINFKHKTVASRWRTAMEGWVGRELINRTWHLTIFPKS